MEKDKPDFSSHLKAVKNILEDGFEHSSIMNCLESKVTEITKLKEDNFALNAQIKIMTESMRLMEAEFAFQRSEFEQEIEMHKNNEENLKKSLLKFETHVPLEIEVYQKLQNMQTEYDKALIKIKELEEEPSDTKYSKLKDKHSKLRLAYQELQANVSHLQKRIDRRNNALEELTKKFQKKEEEMKNISDGLPNGNLSLQKLKQKLQRTTSALEKAEEHNLSLEKQISHCECEFEVLNDILNSHSVFDKEWVEIRKKIKDLLSNYSTCFPKTEMPLSPINTNNAMSKNRSKISFNNDKNKTENSDEIICENCSHINYNNNNKNNNSKNNNENSVSSSANDYHDIEMKLHEVQDAYDKITRFSVQQRIRLSFAKTIAKNHSFVVDKLINLHNTIFDESTTALRPIILMAIFLNRWIKIKQHTIPNQFDDISLMSISAIPKVTFPEKIKQIGEKYIEITSFLVDTKNDLAQTQLKVNSLQQQINQMDANTEEQKKELVATKQTIEVLKEHSESIQEELALAVPPERFEEILSRNTYLELEVDSLTEEAKQMVEETEEKDIFISQLTRQIKANDVIKESKEDELNDIRSISESRCHEIEILKAKLKDKTKELLALERIIHQTNPVLLNTGSISDDKKEDSSINPVFLGNPVAK